MKRTLVIEIDALDEDSLDLAECRMADSVKYLAGVDIRLLADDPATRWPEPGKRTFTDFGEQ